MVDLPRRSMATMSSALSSSREVSTIFRRSGVLSAVAFATALRVRGMAATSLPGGIGDRRPVGLLTRLGLAHLLAGTLGADLSRRDRIQPMMHEHPRRCRGCRQGLQR